MLQRLATWLQEGSKSSRRREQENADFAGPMDSKGNSNIVAALQKL